MGGQAEIFYCNVKIMLHHRPDLIHDEWIKEADEGVSEQGQYIYRPWCFGVNDRKGNNKLDDI